MPLWISTCVAITARQFCSIGTALTLCVSDGISKTVVWKKQDVLRIGTSQMQERSSSARECECGQRGYIPITIPDRRHKNAHRAGRPADGGCPPQTVRRHRAGGALAD